MGAAGTLRTPAIDRQRANPDPSARPPTPSRRGALTIRRAVPIAVLAAVSTLAVSTGSFARPPSAPSSPDAAAFAAVVLPDTGDRAAAPLQSVREQAADAADQIGDFQQEEDRSFAPRANADQPTKAESILKPKPKPTPPPNPTHSVSGRAAWYCNNGSGCPAGYSGGLYAAAGPGLRVGNWRGRVVSVCGSGSCINVKLVDWCACGGDREIDLFADAFQRLAPLGQGTLAVRIRW